MTRWAWREKLADAARVGHWKVRALCFANIDLFASRERRILRSVTQADWPRVTRWLKDEIRTWRFEKHRKIDYRDPAAKAMRYLWLPAKTKT